MPLAVQPSHTPINAWEEAIVPALRKRLEEESRVLENRLSVHSLTSRDEHQLHPQTVASRKESNRSPTPSHPTTVAPSLRSFSDNHRPTAIPRPSTSMAKDSATADQRPHTASSHTARSGTGTTNSSAHPPTRVPFTRSRTRSTPYPFERDNDGNLPNGSAIPTTGRKTPNAANGSKPNGETLTGIPTPASSRANSPMITGSRPNEPRSTKIPMRKRAQSNSNAASFEAHVKGSLSKSTGQALANKNSGPAEQNIAFPPSPETSPDLWKDSDHGNDVELPPFVQPKIRDEAPPFNPNRLSNTGSFEEREFEHWYRGEGRDGGGRNGGRGEIKVAKADTAREMLEIALGGHKLDGRDRWSSRRYNDALDTRTRRLAEQMDYVMDERQLTDMEGDVTDHHPDVTSDLDDYYYASNAVESDSHLRSTPTPPVPLPTPAAPSSSPLVSQPTRTPQPPQANPHPHPHQTPQPKTRAQVAAVQSTPRKPSVEATRRPAGTPAKASGPSQGRTPSRPRQRAISGRQTSSTERAPPLADALPPWAQPSAPPTGNWDDVVLPTVAKKMGLTPSANPEITMLGSDAGPSTSKKTQQKSQVYEPAPGTFAYDSSKIRPSMERSTTELVRPPSPTEPPIRSPTSMKYEYPPREESPPPFASYAVEHEKLELQPPVVPEPLPRRAEPVAAPEDSTRSREKEMRRSRPAVVVAQPQPEDIPDVKLPPDDDEGAGCCRCLIM
ncbi:hypothetical protein FRB99_008010 [Tulasnella sp. 403]|nr:hypothetical protein FRB99_008010 [Tulasnella sp. 403]